MPLSEAVARKPMHKRSIEMRGYFRDDGLWDIEGFLLDTKPFDYHDARRRLKQAGSPVHQMSIRLTVDHRRTIVAAEAAIDSAPHPSCFDVNAGIQAMVGARVASGWKEEVRRRLPERAACTHLSELLVTMATAIFQTQTLGTNPEGAAPFEALRNGERTPFFLDKCASWRLDSENVAELFPQWHTPPSGD